MILPSVPATVENHDIQDYKGVSKNIYHEKEEKGGNKKKQEKVNMKEPMTWANVVRAGSPQACHAPVNRKGKETKRKTK